jgi:stage IV sporulation protein FB
MTWSFKIARIAGTQVRIHLTFFLLLVWVGVSVGSASGPEAGLRTVGLLLLVFLCVLLHEFGHVVAALRYGITTPKITLYPIGGIASLTRIPKRPVEELIVSLAGPLVNFVIAVVLLAISGGFSAPQVEAGVIAEYSMIQQLIAINLILGLFNLIPAFPMDGGRALRAILAMWMARDKATFVATRVGQSFAVAGGVLGVIAHQPILLLVSLFIFFAAGAENAVAETEHELEGLTASDAAMGEFHTLEMSDSVHHAVDLILDGSQPDFPVINDDRQCIGIATRNGILRTLRDKGPAALISDSVEEIPAQIDADVPAIEALRKLSESGLPGAAVVDREGRIRQWLTAENVRELILSRSATHQFVTGLSTR